MKKTYIIPATAVVPVNVKGTILNMSFVKDGTQTLDTSEEILTHEDKGWDIWSDD